MCLSLELECLAVVMILVLICKLTAISLVQSDASPPRVKAPTRLLESAIRDAVAPSGLLGSQGGGGGLRRMDSDRRLDSDRRVRSVVLTDAGMLRAFCSAQLQRYNLLDCPDFCCCESFALAILSLIQLLRVSGEGNVRQRVLRPLSDMSKGIPPAIAVALKAAAAAAADVNNSRHGRSGRLTSSTSVWDRLGGKHGGAQSTREKAVEEVARESDPDEKMEDGITEEQDVVMNSVRTGSRHHQSRRRPTVDGRRLDRESDLVRLDRNNSVAAEIQAVNGASMGQSSAQTLRDGAVRFDNKQEPVEASRPEAVDDGPGKYEFFDDIYEHSQDEDNDETIITLHRPAEDEEADVIWQWSHTGGMDSRNCLGGVSAQSWKVYPEIPVAPDHFGGMHSSQNHSLLGRKDLGPGNRVAPMDTAEDKPNGASSAVDTKVSTT